MIQEVEVEALKKELAETKARMKELEKENAVIQQQKQSGFCQTFSLMREFNQAYGLVKSTVYALADCAETTIAVGGAAVAGAGAVAKTVGTATVATVGAPLMLFSAALSTALIEPSPGSDAEKYQNSVGRNRY